MVSTVTNAPLLTKKAFHSNVTVTNVMLKRYAHRSWNAKLATAKVQQANVTGYLIEATFSV